MIIRHHSVFLIFIACTALFSEIAPLARAKNLHFGSAFYYRDGWDRDEYEKHFLDNFTILTPEGGIMWGEGGLSPAPGEINFSAGNEIIGFAHENDLAVKVHHLVWHRYVEGHDPFLPQWLLEGGYGSAELQEHLKDFITQTVTHYTEKFPHTVQWWSVVNEAGANNFSGFEPNLWLDSIGESYIDSAFVWTREVAPDEAKLFYNDCFYHGTAADGQRMEHKIDHAYDVVSGLVERDIPIDGMGFQSHLTVVGYPGKEAIAADFKRFTDLGLEVYITELDVALIPPVTQKQLEQQAKIYRDLVNIALENEKCTMVSLWGFNDAQSWYESDVAPS
ncbi:endo-1,4-beta-xylanase [Chitinivibrio alkaliphilus]|nr:endo-1,4-beta-xylanase [Chitinivibrio alkaliphilus]